VDHVSAQHISWWSRAPSHIDIASYGALDLAYTNLAMSIYTYLQWAVVDW